ncbi:MAG: hypothetical protein NT066_07950 [Candidatus Omnitrophica bacterium]|nr:hypothetical protein [Candidatus Omnitrophota bacterium]
MAIRARENVMGAWAFLAGIVLAILVVLFSGDKINPYILWVLVGLGLVVGYFVSEKDSQTFLIASVSLVIVSYFGISGMVLNAAISGVQIGHLISAVLGTLLMLFVPATIVAALKSVFSISLISADKK